MSAQKTVYTAVNPFFYPYRTVQFFQNDFTVRVTGKYGRKMYGRNRNTVRCAALAKILKSYFVNNLIDYVTMLQKS